MTQKRTEISNLGKVQLLDLLTKEFTLAHSSSVLGPGDDAAIIDAGTHYKLVATNLLSEGVHFDLTYFPLKHLGYKVVVTGLTDIAAMNGMPEQISINVALSNRFSLEALEELYAGVRLACEHYRVDLVGSDTAPAAQGLAIAITAIGRVAKDKVCQRKGAQPNDIICVTGDLGGAYLGLQVLTREKTVWMDDTAMQPDLAPYEYLVQRQLKAEARTDIVHEFHELPLVPTAMIDVADGLASELFHLSQASQVGLQIYEDKLPIDKRTYETAMSFNINPTVCAMHGGEDYELLFTISPNDLSKIDKHPDVSLIGYVTPASQGLNLVAQGGHAIPLKAQGWEHIAGN